MQYIIAPQAAQDLGNGVSLTMVKILPAFKEMVSCQWIQLVG
jgi:hypothetical protein